MKLPLLLNPRARVKLLLQIRQRAVERESALLLTFVTFRLARWGVYVNRTATIGANLLMGHPTGIVIGQGCVIEDNVGLWQNVTLGSRSINDLSPEQYPRVRSGARIYAGAVVIGAVETGENATVGANSVVLEDVAPGCTVAGVPARLVRTSGSPRTM